MELPHSAKVQHARQVDGDQHSIVGPYTSAWSTLAISMKSCDVDENWSMLSRRHSRNTSLSREDGGNVLQRGSQRVLLKLLLPWG